jgi:parallel beta-helix repeat protein
MLCSGGGRIVRHLLCSFVLLSLIGTATLVFDARLVIIESASIIVPDDYPTIQEAINNAFDGDVIIVKNGTYYENVVVNKTVSLFAEDSSTTIIDGNGTGHVIDVVRDNVNITGFTVRRGGSIFSPDYDAGISLNNTRGCTISNNNITDNTCFGIHLLNSDQNTITGNNITHNGMYAVDLTTSNNNIISSNTATFNTNIAMGMHTTSHDNIITGNTIANNSYGIDAANASNNTISDNYIANNSETGLWIQDNANNNTLSGNTITGSQFGIKILNSIYTEIFNNTIVHNYGTDDWDAGIRLEYAAYTQIHDNGITDNWRGVLLYTSSPHVSVYGNNVTSNEYGIRVAMGGSDYVNVSGNYVADNRGYGVDVTGFGGGEPSNYATVARNVIVNNTYEAVGLGTGSSYNTVIQNEMIRNGHAGVTLERYSNYNTVVENTMIENAYGICFDLYTVNSTQNTIYNNKFIRNTQQIRIAPGSVNEWNSSYPLGGNYWSDYVGADLSSGSYQNVTGGDGIGDTPYVIDINNRDNYPFMLLSICNVTQTPDDGMVSPADEVRINATITHLYPVERVMLNYTVANDTGTFNFSLDMTNVEGDVWNATIPAFPAGTNVTYTIIGQGSEGNIMSSQQQGYTLEYQVMPEFSLIGISASLAITMLLIAVVSRGKIGKNLKTVNRI